MRQSFQSFLVEKAGIAPAEFEQLTPFFEAKKIKAGEYLLFQGETCHHLFYVETGLLRSYTTDDAGKEHIIQFAPEGWFVGDRTSYYFHEPSEQFIQAIEDTEVIAIGPPFTENALTISKAYAIYNEKALQNHIRHQQLRISSLLSASAEKRYMYFIETYFDLTLRVPQWMIASYLGITPESLSRLRKELAKRHGK